MFPTIFLFEILTVLSLYLLTYTHILFSFDTPLKGCHMSSLAITLTQKFVRLLGVTAAIGTLSIISFDALAQSAQQRPATPNTQNNGVPSVAAINSERPATSAATAGVPGSGMAVDGGTAGVVVNNYNSNNNTVNVTK